MSVQDKTVTILAASAAVHSVQFHRVMVDVAGVPTEKFNATAYGAATKSDGGTDSEAVTWQLSGPAETTVKNFMNNQALTQLRLKIGIET